MAQSYKHDIMLHKLDTSIKTLETNPKRTEEDIQKVVELYNKTMKLKSYSYDEIKELVDRLTVFYPELSVEKEEENPIPELLAISPKSYKANHSKLKAGLAGGLLAIALATAISCANEDKTAEVVATEVETENEVEIEPTVVEEVTKVLAENLAFDPNDNGEIVIRMSDFIADALTRGIPVKDVMSEEELKLADENEQSLVTIEQLMDFYMVMNIEDIDPIDYARLGYNTKTAETITDNYMYCARIFMNDALTATNDTKLNYSGIIADKDSRKSVQKFIDYLAEYNTVDNKKELGNEISDYIVSNYINRDANIYSMSINEFTYRMMFVADMISNNSILPTDVNVILNEDGKISCDLTKEDGIKDKTERAEEFTSIYNTVEEKLEISREFINQDLTNISDDEKKPGVELEKEIKEAVLIKNVSYKLNPKFTMSEDSKKISAKKTTKTDYQTFTDNSGKQVNVSAEELAKYGAKNQAEYEAAKKAEFEENAKKDPNHTITNPDGEKVVSGEEVDTVKYNEGFQEGYYDGNNYASKNPDSSHASYVAGYEAGYKQGYADRVALDESLKQQQPKEEYVDVPDVVETPSTTVEEQPYVEEPKQPEIIEEFVPIEQETFEEFVPVEQQVIEEFESVEESAVVDESIEEITYTSSINNLKSLKAELLRMSNVYTEEVSKSKC